MMTSREVFSLPPSRARRGGARAASRDDLHDGARGFRSEERALRSADDLDAVDVRNRQVPEVVAALDEIVGADTVDEHEGVLGIAPAREQGCHRPASAAAHDGQPRHEPQGVGDRLDLGGLQVGRRDDRDGVRRPGQGDVHLRRRDDNRLGDAAQVQHHPNFIARQHVVIGSAANHW